MTSSEEPSGKKSDYEKLRDEKIERNQTRLKQLGLLRNNKPSSLSLSSPPMTSSSKPSGARKLRRDIAVESPIDDSFRRRRSSRLAANSATTALSNDDVFQNDHLLDAVDTSIYISNGNNVTTSMKRRRSNIKKRREVMISMMEAFKSNEMKHYQPPLQNSVLLSSGPDVHNNKSSSKKMYAKEIRLDIHQLCKECLGRYAPHTGKATVVNMAAAQFQLINKNDDDPNQTMIMHGCDGSITVSFNKFSGVLAWKRGFFLWINLGNYDGGPNEFLDNGRQMTWYGGSRMQNDTPVIQSLIQAGKKATIECNNSNNNNNKGVITLWVRFKDQPYICLGRLGYDSHEPNSHPLKFLWNLLDYEELIKDQNKKLFHQIVVAR